MPTQLTASAVSKSYEGRIVLDEVSCALSAGERAGIVGENGSGKTTLLRLFAGQETPDQGEIVAHAEGGIGYLPQEDALPSELTVQEVIDGAMSELRATERRLRELEAAMTAGDESALQEYGELLTVFELRGGYEAEARVERALHGLGLGVLPRERTVGRLSGGERVRLRLAALLAASPEVLLLDEPTNHLDDAALRWLEEHLRSRRGTTVAVSHDRTFLERVATMLLEVDGDRRKVVRYGNGYAGYLAQKAAARRRWAEAYENWRAEAERLRETAATTARRVAPGRAMKDGNKMAYDRAGGRVQQSLAGRVRNAEERLRRLLADPVPPPPAPLHFTPPLRATAANGAGQPSSGSHGAGSYGAGPHGAGPRGAGPRGAVLDAEGVAVAGRLARTGLTVAPGERVLVTGPNGAGKSTLLDVLAGRLEPDTGRVARRGRVGHLPQEPVVGAAPGATLLDAYAQGRPGPREEHAERLVSLGLFGRERLEVPVARLSTGQRQRLALARLVTEPADVLLLDEPTNHLSPALVEELEAALDVYDGALVVVSHDRRLRERWRGGHLALEGPSASPVGAAEERSCL
ncbi:ABC-F family ATP-binding cassette domain-containing protein [Streptomyces albus subsp. chlorinus]|uniref:ABC-F family ATP-binding cassette domain-containing protein n=1 Tax=Streptomyces albus TaxID=1888 RepID=UPI00156F8CBC|nr:ABC-F family ATP-binding cassette domain-containing protein [Streptomyces albus]NSC22501.1 ABC-F family ATP-binding cassette domain-containing protein [Streptomyces albus subsp. chlorinus]